MRIFTPLLAALLAFAPLSAQAKDGPVPPAPLRVVTTSTTYTTATYAYGDDSPSQVLDITYDPNQLLDRPWVLLVHGGSWSPTNNPGRQLMGTAANAFRSAGFATVSIDYRDRSEAPWPAQRLDAANAILWVKRNAATFGLDPDRGGIYGFSAGAQIAATMGTIGAGEVRTRAVIGVSGPYDPFQQWKAAYGFNNLVEPTTTMRGVADAAVELAGCDPQPTNSDCWAATWPTMYAGAYSTADDAPFLLYHGADDPAVPPILSQYLHNRLGGAGAQSTLVIVPEGLHTQGILWYDRGRAGQAIKFMQDNTR